MEHQRGGSVPSCTLRVDLKCCTGCQVRYKRKLHKINGVSSIIYDTKTGLMTVLGHVNAMRLIEKFGKWGKSAELVSVENDIKLQNTNGSPGNSSTTPSSCHNCVNDSKADQSTLLDDGHGDSQDYGTRAVSNRNQDAKKKRKCILLRLLGKKGGRVKVNPFPANNDKWRFPLLPEQARPWPVPAPPAFYPPMSFGTRPPCNPHYGAAPTAPSFLPRPPSPFAGRFYPLGPSLSPPPYAGGYIQSRPLPPPQMVNPMIHYRTYTNRGW